VQADVIPTGEYRLLSELAALQWSHGDLLRAVPMFGYKLSCNFLLCDIQHQLKIPILKYTCIDKATLCDDMIE